MTDLIQELRAANAQLTTDLGLARKALSQCMEERENNPEPSADRQEGGDHRWSTAPGDVPCIGFIPVCLNCGCDGNEDDASLPCPFAPPTLPSPAPVDESSIKRLLFNVLHQRTGAMGTKIEDILFEQNPELLHKCVGATRDLQ